MNPSSRRPVFLRRSSPFLSSKRPAVVCDSRLRSVAFPAIAVEDQTFEIWNVFGKKVHRRKEGEALQPESESLDTLRVIQSTIGD